MVFLFLLLSSIFFTLASCRICNFTRTFYIYNPTDSDLIDEDVLLELNTFEMISTHKLKEDCGDLRVYVEGAYQNFWLETPCGSQLTRLWIQIPSVPSKTNVTVRMNYTCSAFYGITDLAYSGAVAVLTDTASCPDQYEQLSGPSYNNVFIRGGDIFGASNAGSLPSSHTHTISGTTGGPSSQDDISTGSRDYSTTTHTHTYSTESDAFSGDLLPPYMDFFLCKATHNYLLFPTGSISMFSAIPTTGWQDYTDLNTQERFPRIGTTVGGTGGGVAHSHAFSGAVNLDAANQDASRCTWFCEKRPKRDHAHSFSGTSGEASVVPPFYSVLFAQVSTSPEPHQLSTDDLRMFSTDIPPRGYEQDASFSNARYIRGGSVYSATGGDFKHSHTYSAVTAASSGTANNYDNSETLVANTGHTHSLTGTSGHSPDIIPPFVELLVIRRKSSSLVIYDTGEVEIPLPAPIIIEDNDNDDSTASDNDNDDDDDDNDDDERPPVPQRDDDEDEDGNVVSSEKVITGVSVIGVVLMLLCLCGMFVIICVMYGYVLNQRRKQKKKEQMESDFKSAMVGGGGGAETHGNPKNNNNNNNVIVDFERMKKRPKREPRSLGLVRETNSGEFVRVSNNSDEDDETDSSVDSDDGNKMLHLLDAVNSSDEEQMSNLTSYMKNKRGGGEDSDSDEDGEKMLSLLDGMDSSDEEQMSNLSSLMSKPSKDKPFHSYIPEIAKKKERMKKLKRESGRSMHPSLPSRANRPKVAPKIPGRGNRPASEMKGRGGRSRKPPPRVKRERKPVQGVMAIIPVKVDMGQLMQISRGGGLGTRTRVEISMNGVFYETFSGSFKTGRGSSKSVFVREFTDSALFVKQRHRFLKLEKEINSFAGLSDLGNSLAHPHLLRYYGYTKPTGGVLAIVSEDMDESLKEYLQREVFPSAGERLPKRTKIERLDIVRGIALALEHLHTRKHYCFRDLRPEFVLVKRSQGGTSSFGTKGGTISVKLDFALVDSFERDYSSCVYTAPELFDELDSEDEEMDTGNDIMFKLLADSFSLGMIVYEVLLGKRLYEGQELRQCVQRQNADPLFRPKLPENCPAFVSSLTSWCFFHSPLIRPTMRRVLDLLDEREE